MSKLSRRSLVASAAALSALAVPVVAALAATDIGADAWVARLRPEFERVLEVWLRLYALNNDDFWMEYDGDLHLWTALHDRLHPVVDEILQQEATTSTGIALLAQAMAVQRSECFGDEDNDDDIAEFIESVCAFVGTVPAPLVTLDANTVAAFKSDLEARLTATPIDEDNRDQIIHDLLMVQS
jgi:hypothetical protein